MKKITIVIPLIILFAIGVWGYVAWSQSKICHPLASWGRNTSTGQCKYFASSCVDSGYELVSGRDCDCQNIEDPDSDALENCVANK